MVAQPPLREDPRLFYRGHHGQLERGDHIGVVLLSRPYHHDPGVYHEIPADLQKLGFLVFTADVLLRTPARLARLSVFNVADAGIVRGAGMVLWNIG